MNKQTILVVDDEQDIRDAVGFLLAKENFLPVKAEDGNAAIELVQSGERYDLIIMDIVMPFMSGIDTAKELRKYTQCPILFLTAKSSDDDKTSAYESGGDDYLSKPFSAVELMLRVKALLKRCAGSSDEIAVDENERTVRKNGEMITLTDKEYELFVFLRSHSGETFSNSELYEHVWEEKYLPTSSNTVMVHILNLRKKLEDDFTKPRLIQTIWGKGYCYAKTK